MAPISLLVRTLSIAFACVGLGVLPATDVFAQARGRLRICKQHSAADYGSHQEWWKTPVLIPAESVFLDFGLISNPAAPLLKLKIVTLQPARIEGDAKCTTINAVISNQGSDQDVLFGVIADPALPRVRTIAPKDQRILMFCCLKKTPDKEPNSVGSLFVDLPTIEAFIEQEFR